MFYCFRVDKKSLKPIEVCDCPAEDFHPPQQTVEHPEYFEVWPIDDEKTEKVWQWSPPKARKRIDELTFRWAKGRLNPYYKTKNVPINDYETMWVDLLYDASTHGSSLVQSIVGRSFPFPKSVYAVRGCVDKVTWNRPNAVVLDFFAGSGTTMHAVNMLNALDDGQRRCILVTNNEVSETVAADLAAAGVAPDDAKWQSNGICETITWPRCKLSINGADTQGAPLTGEWLTGRTIPKEKPVSVKQLGFVVGSALSVDERRQLCSLLEGVKLSAVTDGPWYVEEDAECSILWEPARCESWIKAIAEQSGLREVYVATPDAKRFREIKARLADELASVLVEEPESRTHADGYLANAAYFKLDFLDPTEVNRGDKFESIGPILWMLAGCKGVPEVSRGSGKWFIPKHSPFAVLLKEDEFAGFVKALADRPDVTHAFLVTDSTDHFHRMSRSLGKKRRCIQLYRSYIDTFRINLNEPGTISAGGVPVQPVPTSAAAPANERGA